MGDNAQAHHRESYFLDEEGNQKIIDEKDSKNTLEELGIWPNTFIMFKTLGIILKDSTPMLPPRPETDEE